LSLLNDALRGAEARRNNPDVPAAYPGQSKAGRVPVNAFVPWLVVLALALMVAVLTLIWVGLKPLPATIARADTLTPPLSIEARREANKAPATETIVVSDTESAAQPRAEKKTPKFASEQPAKREPVSPPTATAEDRVVSNPPASDSPTIKQQRETPELADRRADELIRKALMQGRVAEAEQLLGNIVSTQSAPQSRARFARHLLVGRQPTRALTWLTEGAARDHSTLRLLRARALLALGDSGSAVALLESSIPPIKESVEYRVTLAALLQQQDRVADAAVQWAELIAFDNAKAAWWVGLAIALEADQQARSAARAYQQAMALSDLPPSLADYVRGRLNALGAG